MPTVDTSASSLARTDAGPAQEVIIRPPGAFAHLDLPELWRYRGTLWRKVKQRVRIEYDDMWLGLFWAVARPLIMVFVFWAFRGLSQARIGVQIPYVLYVYSGLVAWFYFTEVATAVAMSLVRDAGLIQKVYFPRLISPLSYLFGETYNLALAAIPLLWKKRVSIRRPPTLNSFQSLVPTGNFHSSVLVASMVAPGGR